MDENHKEPRSHQDETCGIGRRQWQRPTLRKLDASEAKVGFGGVGGDNGIYS